MSAGVAAIASIDERVDRRDDVTGHRIRTLLGSIVTVVLAVSAHVAGEGMAPPVAVLMPVALTVWAALSWMTVRRVRVAPLLVLLGGTQFAVHLMSSSMSTAHHHGGAIDPIRMFTVHAASTIVTAAALALLDRVWWQAVSWLRRRLSAPVRTPVVERLSGRRPVDDDAPRVKPVRLGSVGMRAPPALAAI